MSVVTFVKQEFDSESAKNLLDISRLTDEELKVLGSNLQRNGRAGFAKTLWKIALGT